MYKVRQEFMKEYNVSSLTIFLKEEIYNEVKNEINDFSFFEKSFLTAVHATIYFIVYLSINYLNQ